MNPKQIIYSLFCVFIITACQQPIEESNDGWQDLFDGKTLNGFKQLNGEASYEVINGEIVGTTVLNTPNSFLATEDDYGDFALEIEYWVDSTINSGIQIRSESIDSINNGRVHGYQIEIDPSERAWSCGIYDEGRRGWLYPLTVNQEARTAFKQNEWNKYYIECIGNQIRTWINDVPAAYLVDDVTAKGFIALQVHSIGDSSQLGKQIKWRNIRIKTENIEPRTGDFPYIVNTIKNDLAEGEKAAGWSLAFNGENTDGWRRAHDDKFPELGWKIADGILTVEESGGGEAKHGGDIVTEQEYSAFEFQLEFKLTEGANSGIKYFVTEGYDSKGGSAIGLEYQLLDDAKHPDAKKGRDGNRTLASLYDLMTAEKQARFIRPPGQWNHARLVVKPDNTVEHWLNHQLVLTYVKGSQALKDLIAMSKYKDWEGFGDWEKGRILLQDHGNTVSFKSIKVREL